MRMGTRLGDGILQLYCKAGMLYAEELVDGNGVVTGWEFKSVRRQQEAFWSILASLLIVEKLFLK